MKFQIAYSNTLNESANGGTIKEVRSYYADKREQTIQDFKQLDQILARVDSIIKSPSFAPGVEFKKGSDWKLEENAAHALGFSLSKVGDVKDSIVLSRQFKKTTIGDFKQNVEPLLAEVYNQFKRMDDYVMVYHDVSALYIIIGKLPAIDRPVNRGGISAFSR